MINSKTVIIRHLVVRAFRHVNVLSVLRALITYKFLVEL